MNTYAKNNWIPVDIALPTTADAVVVSIAGWEEPTSAVYNSVEGKWTFADPIFTDKDVDVLAWRLLPPQFKDEDFSDLIFATAEEARKRTFCAIVRAKRGKMNKEFFAIRFAMLEATEDGKWYCDFPAISEGNKKALEDRGYRIVKTDGKWRVSWE